MAINKDIDALEQALEYSRQILAAFEKEADWAFYSENRILRFEAWWANLYEEEKRECARLEKAIKQIKERCAE